VFRRRRADPVRAAFAQRQDGDDLVVELREGFAALPIEGWAAAAPECVAAIAAVRAVVEGLEAEGVAEPASFLPYGLRLCPEVVARLDGQSAAILGLPAPTRLALDLRPVGRIDEDAFRITVRWVQPGGFAVRADLRGALLNSEAGLRRVPEPVWSLHRAAARLSQPTERTERFRLLAELQRLWPDSAGGDVEAETYLKDLRVHYAGAMSLKLRTLTPDLTEFDPVLFSTASAADADGEASDEEADSVLGPAAQRLFAQDRFRREGAARPVYVLRDGEYVFIDPALRPALDAVRKLQDSPEAERRRFVLNPRLVLRERLGDELADQVGLERLFVETDQFSARVAGVDVWRAPVLPWLVPAGGGGWLPERFGLRIGETYYTVHAYRVGDLLERVETASSQSRDVVAIEDLVDPAETGAPPASVMLPLTDQSVSSVRALAPFARSGSAGDHEDGPDDPQRKLPDFGGKLFLVVRDNFEDVEYTAPEARSADAIETVEVVPPASLRTELKPHQKVGLEWLATAQSAGLPGVLLADDMGLGKTLQAIAFMAWRRAEVEAGRAEPAPCLIVAPTGLLGTWRKEIGQHLREPGLGDLVPTFGSALKQLKEEDAFSARDIETGRAALNGEAWRDAGVVLTTYETMRDYHFSFAKTRFSVVIFDEIQKLKNPASQVTRAAMALNAEFALGMTGTPVENRLQDLWSIMNVVAPGVLGSSRDFERRHAAGDAAALAALKHRLCDPQNGVPPLLLRRLKSEILTGLPKKHLHPMRLEMPAAQANAYRDVVVRAAAAAAAGNLGKGGMLSALSDMKGISLHPLDPRHAPADLSSYAADSARLTRTLAILEDIAPKREKVLIFLEDLAMQDRLAVLVQSRFGLCRLPARINGEIPGFRRQQIVDDFQSRPDEFDVLILSPKAGGVGLTITAANHVVHLSRWWNPAVEDQATDRVYRMGQTREVHVHFPMAVHPDPAIGPSSFDLRLDALIERKRTLTRDLFLPPDASDADINELFREVSLSDAADDPAAEMAPSTSEELPRLSGPETIGSGITAGSESAEETGGEPLPPEVVLEPTQVARSILSVATPSQQSSIRMWRISAYQSRPTEDLLSAFEGKTVVRMVVRDPYSLCTAASRAAQVRFARLLADRARSLESVTIEYCPDIEGDRDESTCRREIGALFVRHFPGTPPKIDLARRRKRGVDDDFHDRFVDIDVRGAGGAEQRHWITIGRGLEALFDDRRQCTVTYVPPGAPLA
jgi:hypothetical protein